MLLDIYSEKLVQMNLPFVSLPMQVPQHGTHQCSGRHLSEHCLCFLKESRKMGGSGLLFSHVAGVLTKVRENGFQFLIQPRRTHAHVS